MALKDHKQELQHAREIALLIQYAANKKRQEEIAEEKRKQQEAIAKATKQTAGVVWGEW